MWFRSENTSFAPLLLVKKASAADPKGHEAPFLLQDHLGTPRCPGKDRGHGSGPQRPSSLFCLKMGPLYPCIWRLCCRQRAPRDAQGGMHREGCSATFGGHRGEGQLQQCRILPQTPSCKAAGGNDGSWEEGTHAGRSLGPQHHQNKGPIYTRPDTGTLPWQQWFYWQAS